MEIKDTKNLENSPPALKAYEHGGGHLKEWEKGRTDEESNGK